jgi:hypothetical protein
MLNVTIYGKHVFGPGTNDECWTYIHKNQDRSVDWAIAHKGYRIIPARDAELIQQHRDMMLSQGRMIGQAADGYGNYYVLDGKVYIVRNDPVDVTLVEDYHILCDGLRKGWFTGFVKAPDFHLESK